MWQWLWLCLETKASWDGRGPRSKGVKLGPKSRKKRKTWLTGLEGRHEAQLAEEVGEDGLRVSTRLTHMALDPADEHIGDVHTLADHQL